MSVDGRGWNLPVSTLCTGAFIGGRVTRNRKSYAAVDSVAQRTANTTEQGTAHTAEAQATRRVVGRGRRSRGWSFRFDTLHHSCACTHRHRI